MARLKEIKEKYPLLSKSLIDVLSDLDISKTNKYVPIFLKLIEEDIVGRRMRTLDIDEYERKYYFDEVSTIFDIEPNIDNKELYQLYSLSRMVTYYADMNTIRSVRQFMDYYERKLIKVDLNDVKSEDDIRRLISQASLKDLIKVNEKAIKIEHRTDEWLVLRPLTYESSLKYGAATKWCTCSVNEPSPFFDYTTDDILLYCINMKTGDKVACHITLRESSAHNSEYSFWNSKDIRIDSMFSGLPKEVLDVIVNVEKVSNRSIDEEQWMKSRTTHIIMNHSEQDLIRVEPMMDISYNAHLNNVEIDYGN
jgi:hypothetical protein